jgi:hypothetical protein
LEEQIQNKLRAYFENQPFAEGNPSLVDNLTENAWANIVAHGDDSVVVEGADKVVNLAKIQGALTEVFESEKYLGAEFEYGNLANGAIDDVGQQLILEWVEADAIV